MRNNLEEKVLIGQQKQSKFVKICQSGFQYVKIGLDWYKCVDNDPYL